MFADRLSQKYEHGVNTFMSFALENASDPEKIFCPCTKCLNVNKNRPDEVKYHLFRYGIDEMYTSWTKHGEICAQEANLNSVNSDDDEDDQLVDMIYGMNEFDENPEKFSSTLRDAEEPLYANCTKFTKLSAVLKLFNLKASNGWSDKGFSSLLQIFKEMLPDENVLPDSTYKAKKLIRVLSLDYERIHACSNDCVLYRKEYESLDCCPKCALPRYKRPGVPSKVLWYFPIIPRFKRLFSNAEDAKNLRWHAEGRKNDGKMRHPSDAAQWFHIDKKFPEFGDDPRNLRVALSTDGMNPFSNQSTSHSCWPVVLVIYNLPSWMCMKRKYMMLSLLISGPRQPGIDIDVYLAPLVEDFKTLWQPGVEVYDAYTKMCFRMHAMLFCTINDFPAYGNLSGYTVKGRSACPICEENTSSLWLDNCKKTVYL